MIAVLPLCGEWETALSVLASARPSMVIALTSGKCGNVKEKLDRIRNELRCDVRLVEIDEDRLEDYIPRIASEIQRYWDGSITLLMPSVDAEQLAALLSMAFLPRYIREGCTILARELNFSVSKLLERLRPKLSATEKMILETLESLGGCSRAKDLANTLGISRSSLYRSISKLLELGFVKRENRGYYCLERGR